MNIKRVVLENFRCFSRLEVDFSPQMTVLVAGNGQGKTTILDAVKYLLGVFVARFPKTSVPRVKESDFREEWRQHGTEEYKCLPAPYMRLAATADIGKAADVSWDIMLRRDKSRKTQQQLPETWGTENIHEQADDFIDHDNDNAALPLPVFAYYATERVVKRNKPEHHRLFRKAYCRYQAYSDALDHSLNYQKLVEWFCYLEDKQRREREEKRDWDYQSFEYSTIQLALAKMLPHFKNLRTTSRPLDLKVDVDDGRQEPKTCRIDTQLSDGYKMVLALVLDLVSRILEANILVDGMTPETILHSSGVVLIDEVDLHLHPRWQQQILVNLRQTFPNIQFIVTTHSPQVVSSVPAECVRIVEEGAIRVTVGSEGAEASRVLKRIFGTEPFPADNIQRQKLQLYLEQVYAGKWRKPEVMKLRSELDDVFQGEEPLLDQADLFIENEAWEEEHDA